MTNMKIVNVFCIHMHMVHEIPMTSKSNGKQHHARLHYHLLVVNETHEIAQRILR